MRGVAAKQRKGTMALTSIIWFILRPRYTPCRVWYGQIKLQPMQNFENHLRTISKKHYPMAKGFFSLIFSFQSIVTGHCQPQLHNLNLPKQQTKYKTMVGNRTRHRSDGKSMLSSRHAPAHFKICKFGLCPSLPKIGNYV